MNINVKTDESLELARSIAKNVKSFHTYHHILYDIAKNYYNGQLTYVEIGCFAGASACLMVQLDNARVISVDIGRPVKMKVALSNVAKYNRLDNFYRYIQGDSAKKETILHVQKLVPEGIDILFIDGSHKFKDVISDFQNYEQMVNPGGFIVFDDYDDLRYSPEVRQAVDYLSSCFFGNYTVMERFKNEFIIRKNGNE